MRINKYIAQATGKSRRESDELIEQGRVLINDQPARIGQQISDSDIIKLDNMQLTESKMIYLMFNKPVGYVCSRKKQGDNDTIYSLIDDKYHELKPVGRLDKDSSGIMLLTNDGEFAHQMTHPKFKKQKMYLIETDSKLSDDDIAEINRGIMLEDGLSKMQIEKYKTMYKVTMSEGRNRQIRRTIGSLGHKITMLKRLEFGPYKLTDMGSEMTKESIKKI